MFFLVLWGFSICGWSQLVVVGLTDAYIWASLRSCCGFLLSHSDLYSLVRCVLSALCLRKSLSLFLSASIISFVLLLCAPARSCIPLAIFESVWFCDRTFLFLWGATINFLLLLTGVSVGALRMTFCSPSSFKLSSSDFWKLFSSSVNWRSKSLSILSFCKLNERSSLPSAKWRLSFFSEKGLIFYTSLVLLLVLNRSRFYICQKFYAILLSVLYTFCGVFLVKCLMVYICICKIFRFINFYKMVFPTFLVKYFLDKCKNFIVCRFFRASFSRAAAKLCSSSAKTSANKFIYYINIILI